jgi:hypothetical protein
MSAFTTNFCLAFLATSTVNQSNVAFHEAMFEPDTLFKGDVSPAL